MEGMGQPGQRLLTATEKVWSVCLFVLWCLTRGGQFY